jgi:hypothetical protein
MRRRMADSIKQAAAGLAMSTIAVAEEWLTLSKRENFP